MVRARSLLGPLMFALSVWCAAGRITVASNDSAAARIAAGAPWWVFVIAFVAALAVPAWRRKPSLAAPALLATVAWWPVPLPPIALLWTGPLAWLPILLTVGVALAVEMPATLRTTWSRVAAAVGVSHGDRAHLVAGALTLVVAVACAKTAAPRSQGGDQPHYLAITQSLMEDGDLKVENNYRSPQFLARLGFFDRPDFIQRGRDGQVYSIHAPGLGVLVLPGYKLAGYLGAQAVVIIVAALTGALIWRIGWRATGDAGAAWFGWAAVVLSAPFLFGSFTVFPDGPGALGVAAGVLLILKLAQPQERRETRLLVAASVLLAALPWLHTRFVVLAAGLGALIVWQLLTDRARPFAARRTRALLFLVVPFISAALWFLFFQLIYGTPNPAAPYGLRPENRAAFIPGGFVGLLGDAQFGLLAYSPVLIAAAFALRRYWRLTAVVALYVCTVATYPMWFAGRPATPARFLIALLPIVAVLSAVSWHAADAIVRKAWLVLLASSILVSAVVVAVHHSELAWNDRTGQALWLQWLGPLVNLRRGWPSFFWMYDPEKLWTVLPFMLQAIAWVAVFVLVWMTMKVRSRTRAWPAEAWRIAVVWWLVISTTAAVAIGWWMTGVSGLDASRSQLALLGNRPTPGAMGVGPWGWHRVADVSHALTIRSDELGVIANPPPLAEFTRVPAGVYELRFITSRPRRAEVTIRIDGRRPLRTIDLVPLNEQSVVLKLPAGAEHLTIAGYLGPRLNLTLRPIQIDAVRNSLAHSATRYQTTDTHFIDDHVFVEDAGFWVKGGRSAEMVFAASPGTPALSILVKNGAVENPVHVAAGSFQKDVPLQPSEQRLIEVPIGDSSGVVRVSITSPAGFRPSDTPPALDARLLGVWVEVR